MTPEHKVQVPRAYEEPERGDGTRALVDRIWPRGLTKSTQLRKWYHHDPDRSEEFGRRYHSELEDPERAEALAHLRELTKHRTLTLLTATKQPEISEAEVLAGVLRS